MIYGIYNLLILIGIKYVSKGYKIIIVILFYTYSNTSHNKQ